MSQNRQPLVTIIVPSFNQGRFIRETLDSILHQDYRPMEVLVLDGNSSDQTVTVLQSYGDCPELRWWSEPDEGVADAVNKGLQRANGDIIGIQSSDDVYVPGALRRAVEAFCEDSALGLMYGDVEYIDEHSQVLSREVLEPFDLGRYLGRLTYIPQPTAFFRASVAAAVGGWREEVGYAADADFWMRIAVGHKVRKLDGLMGRYRYHEEQRDTQKSRICRDWERAIKDLLAKDALDSRVRPWARMGIHLARYKYFAQSGWRERTWHLYRAALCNPRALTHPAFPKRELLPGREPIWNLLSRVKRRLGFAPRRG